MAPQRKKPPKRTVKPRFFILLCVALAAVAAGIAWVNHSSSGPAVSEGESPSLNSAEIEALGAFAPHVRTVSYQILATNYLTLRDSPYGDGEVIRRLDPDEVLEVLDWVGSYYLVRTESGEEGYVTGGYLAPSEPDAFLSAEGIVDVTKQHYGYDEMMADLSALAGRYPELMTVTSAGTSLDGRDIPVVVAGNPGAETQIFIQASIHSREYMCTLLVMKQLEYFLSGLQSGSYDGDDYAFLRNTCFHLMPMANPDGVMISMDGPDAIRDETLREGLDAIYESDRKDGVTDLSEDEYFAKWKADARGVNLNLNFDAQWDTVGTVDHPSTSGYRGSAPASEPETQALIDYTLQNDFVGTISYHAYGSGYYWDFNQQGELRVRTAKLAWQVQAVSGYVSLDDLMGEPSAAGYKDWALDALEIPSLTVEIGTSSCPMEIREFPTVWERNRDLWEAVARWAHES